jgi:hypothetical protein
VADPGAGLPVLQPWSLARKFHYFINYKIKGKKMIYILLYGLGLSRFLGPPPEPTVLCGAMDDALASMYGFITKMASSSLCEPSQDVVFLSKL